MPLLPQEIVPGAVAILETEPLFSDPRVVRADDNSPFRSGPFLCVGVKDGLCAWLTLTTQVDRRGLRLLLRPEWLLEGSETWRKSTQLINDARKPFIGPLDVFVTAGANELPHQPHNRPQVAPAGVAAAIAEMRRYGVKAL